MAAGLVSALSAAAAAIFTTLCKIARVLKPQARCAISLRSKIASEWRFLSAVQVIPKSVAKDRWRTAMRGFGALRPE